MKKIMMIALFSLVLVGCNDDKIPVICTEALAKADEAIVNFQNSKNIPDEYKSQPINKFKLNQAAINEAINNKVSKKELIGVCTAMDAEITKRISLFNY